MGGERNIGRVKVLVAVLIFRVPSGTTRVGFERGCDEAGMYCFAIIIGNKRRTKGRTFRITLNKAEREHGVAEDRDRKSVGMV